MQGSSNEQREWKCRDQTAPILLNLIIKSRTSSSCSFLFLNWNCKKQICRHSFKNYLERPFILLGQGQRDNHPRLGSCIYIENPIIITIYRMLWFIERDAHITQTAPIFFSLIIKSRNSSSYSFLFANLDWRRQSSLHWCMQSFTTAQLG